MSSLQLLLFLVFLGTSFSLLKQTPFSVLSIQYSSTSLTTLPPRGKKPSLSREQDIALKIKRLKQMRQEGKNYKEFIFEKGRIEEMTLGKSQEDKRDLQKRVTDYKDNVMRERVKRGTMNSYQELKDEVNKSTFQCLFLPDVGMKNVNREFYASLLSTCTNEFIAHDIQITALDMPDIYAYNTKRYEAKWMAYLRGVNNPSLFEYDLIIAHGTSADALLRFMETDRLKGVVLIDGSHIYTAGERHGRGYHYELMKTNSQAIAVMATSTETDEDSKVTNIHNYISSYFSSNLHICSFQLTKIMSENFARKLNLIYF